MTTRLEKFRGYMARLNPAGDPRGAVRDGFYVPRPGRSTADEVAARLELDPTSSHLIVGGIGSGKTTQLLVACERLNKLADTRAEYIDVSLVHDLRHMDPGMLIIAAGLALGRLLKSEDNKVALTAGEQFRRWAYGHERHVWIRYSDDDYPPQDDDEPPDEPGGYYNIIEEKPLLSSPEKPIDPSVEDKALRLSQIRSGLRGRFPHLVLLFDSLDRLSDPAAFATVVEEDEEAAQAEFDRFYREWLDAVCLVSSLTRKVNHPAYQQIIAMGKRAIPPILRDLEKEPKLWGPALQTITGARPVPERDEGKIPRVAAAWLGWARENGYDW